MQQQILCFFTVCWLTLPGNAAAQSNFGIALVLEGYELDLHYPTQALPTQLNAISLRWNEKLSDHIHGGILLGIVDGTQGNNPVPAARVTTGNYLGINLFFAYIQNTRLSLGLNLDYRYFDLVGTADTQNAKWRWHQGSISLDGRLGLTDAVSAVFGLSANGLAGEEVLTGPISQVTDFDAEHSVGARIGLLFDVAPQGHIGLEMQSGFSHGGRLYFERWF